MRCCFLCASKGLHAQGLHAPGFVADYPLLIIHCRHRSGPTCSLSKERWCKACGTRNGRAEVGVWYRESNLDQRDQDHRSAEQSTLHLRGGLSCVRCSKRDRPWELLWGCGDCFRKEKARRRDLELFQASAGRHVPAATARWLKIRMRRWEHTTADTGGGRKTTTNAREEKAPVDRNGPPSRSEIPSRRETRCKDCWRFPVRRKGAASDAVHEALHSRFWCDPCQALLRRAVEKGEKVNDTTSVG